MTSAFRGVIGISILMVAAAGCDDGGSNDPQGPSAVTTGAGGTTTGAGGSTSSGAGGTTGGSGGTGMLPSGVPLTPADGWVDGASNTLMIQGAMFSYADTTTITSMTGTCTTCGEGPITFNPDGSACIKGEAAKVDMACTPMAPAVDCYGQYWGAAIGLNLNQPIDMTTMMGSDPIAFDASAITGFAFEISGTTVPTSIRFKVEDASGEFCTGATKPILIGANTVSWAELTKNCWTAGGATAEAAKSGIIKIAWQVVTNASSAVPFDFCVGNIRALQ